MSNKQHGDEGEREIIDKVPCPNCESKLMALPPSFPLYDVQCTRCMFRAQVKTNNRKPSNVIFGAGYDIYEKVLKAGYLAPSLIVLFRWYTKSGFNEEARFYPFIAKGNIRKYRLSPAARRAGYNMFVYHKLDKVPHMVLFKSLDPNLKKPRH